MTMAAMRRISSLIATVTAALLIPAAAHAGTLSYEGDTLVYRAAPGVSELVQLGKDDDGKLTVSSKGRPRARARVHARTRLRGALPDARARAARARRRRRWNSFDSGLPRRACRSRSTAATARISCRPTAPTRTSCSTAAPATTSSRAGTSNDTLLGGPGDDEIQGSGGADHIEGGDGNDLLEPDYFHDPASDYVDGGAGIDKIDDYTIPGDDFHPPVSLTMDGVANDGRPGEGDNVINVEKVESHVSGTFAGGAGDDDFAVWPTSTRATRRSPAAPATTS